MNEVDIAISLMRDGFASAKNVMERILHTPIAIERIENDDYAIQRLILNGGPQIQVLKTELKGEIVGACFLLLTESDVHKISNACLPEKINLSKSKESELMKAQFLMEIDNMIAAAVITEFANFFDILAYGDVPTLEQIPSNSLNNYLEFETSQFETVIHSRAIFHAPDLAISPHFIWIFQGELLDKIKNVKTTN